MAMVRSIITLDGTAQQAFLNVGQVRRIRLEPLRTNSAGFNVGTSAVTVNGTGTGVIQQVAQPPAATIAADAFEDRATGGHNTVDAAAYYVRGTALDSVLASYWTV